MDVSWQMIVSGFLGGCAAELVHWFRMRRELHKGLPDWAKSWLYWTVTIIMAVAGGLLVYLHAIDSNPILAFNIGASAPFILTSLTDQSPKVGPGRSESD